MCAAQNDMILIQPTATAIDLNSSQQPVLLIPAQGVRTATYATYATPVGTSFERSKVL